MKIKMIDFETIVTQIYCMADDFYKQYIDNKGKRRGAPPKLSDAELLTLLIIQQLIGIESELSFLRFQRRFLSGWFAEIDQSQFNRRAKSIIPVMEKFLYYLYDNLNIDECNLMIIDSCPIRVVHPQRIKQSKSFPELSFGYCPSLKEKYYGAKLHLVINAQGVPIKFDLSSANIADIAMLDELLEDLGLTVVLGDKGYIDQERQNRLKEKQNIELVTPKRSNQKQQISAVALELYRKVRKIIEAVFNQLSDHMQLQRCKATSLPGLVSRVFRKLTAFSCGIFLNICLGRKRLAIKSLLA